MKEFKEKRVHMTMEISVCNIEKINDIIKSEKISFNEFINRAIKNNFKDNITKINIYQREESEAIKLRILESIYMPISKFTKKYNISITKIISYCINEEIKKYNLKNKNN